ncbi:MAG: hypothetical protein ABSB96_02595 [Gaiellaceae bacterium]
MSARFLVACCAASLALVVPATAGASASSKPGGGSAVDQYAQQVSNGGGKVMSGVGKNKKTHIDKTSAATLKHLNKAAQNVVGEALTSPWSGATETKLHPVKTPPSNGFRSSLVGSLLASVGSPGAGSGNRLIALLIAIVSITAALGITAARKQRALHQIRH